MTPFKGRLDRCTLRGGPMHLLLFPKEPGGFVPASSPASPRPWLATLVVRVVCGWWGAMGGLLSVGGFGCEVSSSDTPPVATATPRIVSLSPAITTMLVDVGAEDAVVGRTPWCRGVDDRPVVGTLEGVDAEVLVTLAPTIVIHQPPATGTDPVLEGLRERLGFDLVGGRIDGIGDIDGMLQTFGEHGLGDANAIAAWRRRISETFHGGRGSAAQAFRPRTIILHSVDPFGVAGRATYLDDVIEAAGGVNAIQESGWQSIGAEAMLALEPDIVLVVGDATAADMVQRVSGLGWTGMPVVVHLDDSNAMEPSTRICDVADRARTLIEPVSHGEKAP